jgi:uncharacterized membrane protein
VRLIRTGTEDREEGFEMERTSHRNMWIGLAVVALFFFALPAFGGGMLFAHGFGAPAGAIGPNVGPMAGQVGFHPWMVGLGFMGLLIRLAVWAGIIFLAINLFRGRFRRPYQDEPWTPRETDLSSEEILRRRYAAGEITREQYDEMRQVLQS